MVMRNTGTGDLDYFDIQHNQIAGAGQLTTAPTSTRVFGLAPA